MNHLIKPSYTGSVWPGSEYYPTIRAEFLLPPLFSCVLFTRTFMPRLLEALQDAWPTAWPSDSYEWVWTFVSNSPKERWVVSWLQFAHSLYTRIVVIEVTWRCRGASEPSMCVLWAYLKRNNILCHIWPVYKCNSDWYFGFLFCLWPKSFEAFVVCVNIF